MQSRDEAGTAKASVSMQGNWVTPRVQRLAATEAEVSLVGGVDSERTS